LRKEKIISGWRDELLPVAASFSGSMRMPIVFKFGDTSN
jgi:hypothetical protein